jgi:CheY-like chemotaxis protein
MKTILIGEDNPANQELVTEILQSWGYSVQQASTGPEVVSMVEASTPDLILLDIQMPEMDGFAVVSRLRANEKVRHIPIVALTAYAMRGDRERALQGGFDGYVTKPLDRALLRYEIQRLIEPGALPDET